MHQQSLFKSLFARKVILGATLGSAVLFMIIGVILWGGFNWGMEVTNTEKFCISCHEMQENVFVEYTGTVHDANRSGVKASCPDCHVPRPWVHKIIRKIQASNEIYHKLLGTVDTPEKFDEHRLTMARRVWTAMKTTDSRECRNCHDWDTMNPEKQKPRARKQHLFAMENGNTCIDCHKGIAHKEVHKDLPEEELEKWAAPIAAYKSEVPESFKQGLARVEISEAEEAAKQQELTRKEREQRKAEAQLQQQKIEQAVNRAIEDFKAQQKSNMPAAAVAEPGASGASRGFGVDWSNVPERLITLFYPGQTSMEWTLVGKYHGGVRPFMAGDRCMTCHDKETGNMGYKMVTGEKAEPTPIPGKAGSIPVTVQAAHDDENLFLRFQWEDTEHAPVPFVDGGKMDPENQIKLAVMFATDEVKYASQAGCWGTCHHDTRTMPEHPDDPAAAGFDLDLSKGVTKYISESRTDIEEKGRRGKKLGGWDKLKQKAEIDAELASGKFMDLIRWSSSGKVENGHILEQRYMMGGDPIQAQGWKESGLWTVEFKRKLKSDKPGDVTLNPDMLYNFGFAIHDDFSDSRFHHVSLGYKLGLDNSTAEVNAVKTAVKAVTAAPPKASVKATAPAAAVSKAKAAVDAGIDWTKSGERQITLFYPGQASMEWTLVGKYHGGVRPFMEGDRCMTCHDKETADMGRKIVTGEKAETTPIEGKRGSIPVSVQATHDTDNLYLRFQWQNTDHVPVSFVDGGKMDPANQVKLAVMFATDEVKYASQAGCWGTCHHDSRAMPEHPDDPASSGLALDFSKGVTKYISESRTEIEEKGRRGKTLGGWDKLKTAEQIHAEMEAGHMMDILRVNSGDGSTEDGHVLDQRIMSGGQGLSASISEQGGYWTVVMKRKLVSGKPGDVSLQAGTLYNFGFAIHDDFSSARFHHVSLGYKLGLDNTGAEVNAISQ